MSREEIAIEVLDENSSWSVAEFIRYTHVERTYLHELVDTGLLEPAGAAEEQWQFAQRDLRRWRTAQRLISDLGVNLSGAALILDLIEERDALHAQVTALQRLLDR